MKPKREIYAVRFNKVAVKDDLYTTTYTLGVPYWERGAMVAMTPVKIELIKEETRVLTTFSDKTQHEFGYEPSVELFWREVAPKSKTTKTETI